jgi:hypothetical protein
LIDSVDSILDEDDWIFVNIDEFDSDPLVSNYYYISADWIRSLPEEEVFIDDEGFEMPVKFRDRGLRAWKVVGDLKFLIHASSAGGDSAPAALLDVIAERDAARPNWAKSKE